MGSNKTSSPSILLGPLQKNGRFVEQAPDIYSLPRIRTTRQAIGSARPGSQRLQEKGNFSTTANLEFNEIHISRDLSNFLSVLQLIINTRSPLVQFSSSIPA